MTCSLAILGCSNAEQAALKTASLSLGDTVDESAMVMGTERLLADSYVNMVTVSAEAAQTTEQMDVREGSIRWRILTASQLDRIHAITDPRVRFAALWTLAVQMRIAFTEGENKTRFGDQQYRYAEFAKAFETTVLDLGYKAFPDDDIRLVIPEIDQMARTVGVSGWFTQQATRNSRQGAISQLISVPLSPISGLRGVGDTPAAINEFTQAAREMTRVVNNIPERTRWQTELMLLEAQTSGAVAAALKEFADFRKAIEKLSTNVPEQIHQVLQDPKLAEALQRVQLTSQEIGRASADIRQTLIESQAASSAAGQAAIAVRGAAEVIRGPEPAATQFAQDDRDKFRLTDVEVAAARVQAAAVEIRQLVTDLRTGDSVPALAAQADHLVTRITWSLALLIALAFLAGLGLILISRVLRKPHTL